MSKGGSPREKAPFSVDADTLHDLLGDRDDAVRLYRSLGGLQGVAKALKTDAITGRSDTPSMESARKAHFGKNALPPPEEVTFWGLFWGALSDQMMLLLCASAGVSLVLGLTTPNPHTGQIDWEHGWIEGTAILVSVFIVTTVTSLNDYQKEKKFRELSDSGPPLTFPVHRNGTKHDVNEADLLVGDVLHLVGGNQVPVDGVLIKGVGLSIDESAATGENDEVIKTTETDPFFRSGSNILEGEGTILVTGVGENSFAGKITMGCRQEKQDTPLQEQLNDLADKIGQLGFLAAIVTFTALAIKELYHVFYLQTHPLIFKKFLDNITTAVTIVVVAVPEGLPLSVTIALAYSMKQMMHENNLVRHLAACETMGGATSICTDKTGTLTQNEMTVMRVVAAMRSVELKGVKSSDTDVCKSQILSAGKPNSLSELLCEGIAVNTSVERKRVAGPTPGTFVQKYVGNKTEQALLQFVETLGTDPIACRQKVDAQDRHSYPFTSKKKRMTTCVRMGSTLRFHVKGASELLLADCTTIHTGQGLEPITETTRESLMTMIMDMARNRLRTIAIAYADVPGKGSQPFADTEADLPQPPFTLIGLVGIEDPIRPEVEGAVDRCKKAGVCVRMVTGDNKATAISIAKKAGIYGHVYSGKALGEMGLAMEGKDFREYAKSERKLDKILPKLQVLARASPLDKQILVAALMKRGEVVAVTGDGTNDAPALKNANVGFAMNSGTEVAKKASDVVILDDNFRSIVTALKWGRNVNDNICKFIQFQTTVNIAAVLISFIGAVTNGDGESPLKPVQLLWLNLIMDTMAALALATEPPSEEVLDRLPKMKESALITRRMWVNILGQSAYQIVVQLWLLNEGYHWFNTTYFSDVHLTVIFNVFVLMQVTNEFNARKLTGGSLNVFSGLSRAPLFVAVIIVTLIVQYFSVTIGGTFMKTVPLSEDNWIKSLIISVIPLPLGMALRLIPAPEPHVEVADVGGDEEEDCEAPLQKATFRRAGQRIITQLKVSGALASSLTKADQF